MPGMADRQWLRRCSLVVGSLEISSLRIVFQTYKADFETPNHAEIRVYNLADDTAQRVQREFTKVVLQGGYEGNFGLLFGGNIRQIRRGRERGTDTYLDILASDGDRAYNYAVVSRTLAAGAGPRDQVRACQDAMRAEGVEPGYTADMGARSLPRGKVMHGMARKYLRDTAETTDTTWSIQDGRMQMVPRGGYLPGEAVRLTHETGLIGQPEQTNEGTKVRALINPRFRVGGRIQLDNRAVVRIKTDLRTGAFNKAPRLDEDGLYRILAVEFRGDTHGQDWYADLICVGIDDSAPIGSKIIDSNGGR